MWRYHTHGPSKNRCNYVYTMPTIPRTDAAYAQAYAKSVQRRLIESPVSRVILLRDEDIEVEEGRWTLDDNIAAQSKGWIIAVPGSELLPQDQIPELFSLTVRYSPSDVMEQLIKPYIHDGGLEAKAYATLVGLKLKYPDHKFMYECSADELPHPWGSRNRGGRPFKA